MAGKATRVLAVPPAISAYGFSLESNFAFVVENYFSHEAKGLGGGIGRHKGLKIPWSLAPCEFDSRPRHQSRETGDFFRFSFFDSVPQSENFKFSCPPFSNLPKEKKPNLTAGFLLPNKR